MINTFIDLFPHKKMLLLFYDRGFVTAMKHSFRLRRTPLLLKLSVARVKNKYYGVCLQFLEMDLSR